MNWFIGIDGGGTRTRALIVNASGAVLGVGEAGSSNYHSVGISQAVDAVQGAVAAARSDAHVSGPSSGAFLGLAGVKTASDHLALREPLARLNLVHVHSQLAIDHDLRIALAGGCGDGPGIVVVAGTGSAAYGRDRQGHTAQVGGWGWLLDDQGGGVWLAIQGLRAVMEATDRRGPATRLQPALFAELGVTNAREAMQWAQRPDTARAQLAALAPVVLAATEDDDVARAIVQEGARQLQRIVTSLIGQLDFSGEEIEVVPAGGLLGSDAYGGAFRRELDKANLRVRLKSEPPSALVGAVILAAQSAGTPFSSEARDRLIAGVRERNRRS